MTGSAPIPLVLSKIVEADRIRPAGMIVDYVPETSQRIALAAALGLAAIDSLSVAFELQRRGRKIHVKGTLGADLHYVCVVSLEPFPARIAASISVHFEEATRTRTRSESLTEVEVPFDEDAPEPLMDGRIDLGAITQEFLALELDPYPRKPGASLNPVVPAQDIPAPSPFAGLAALLPDTSGKKH